MNRSLRTLAYIIAELLLWTVPAAAFIGVYVLYFQGPYTAVVPHMKLIGSMAVALMGVRHVVEYVRPGRAARTAFQGFYSLWLVLLLLYYALILFGLSNWGRVPTWRLTAVYFHQWRELFAVLDVPVMLVPLVLSLVCGLIFLLVRLAHSRLPWPQNLANFIRLRMSLVLAVAGLVPFAVFASQTVSAVNRSSGEPIMLNLNPAIVADAGQNNLSGGAWLLDKREADSAAAYRPGVLTKPRNVILIVADALRSDRLSVLGYSRPTTPYLDSLAVTGRLALAQRIQSVCSESYCGLMGIACSKFAHEFSRESLTLQQVLAQHGYRIALVLGGDHTNFYGLSTVLGPTDIYWDNSMGATYVNDDRAVVERVSQFSDWDGRPTFLQLHLMSTHGLGQRQDEFVRFTPSTNYYRPSAPGDIERRRNEANNYYDNGVSQFDSIVKQLLDMLQQRGYLEDALVVVTSDHGEMLGEYGHYSHGKTVYQQVLDVPLLILRAGYTGPELKRRAFASQVDIAPTVLRELGLPVPVSWSGSALQNSVTREFIYFQQGMEIGLFDLRDSEKVWKFWIDTASEKYFAFDAIQDIVDSRNRIDELPAGLRQEWMLKLLPAGAAVLQPVPGNHTDVAVNKDAN